MRHLSQRILSFLLILPFGAALQSCVSRSRASSGTKKSLKLPYCGFVNLGLFPVREGHKLIQNFLQSLEPPSLVGGSKPGSKTQRNLSTETMHGSRTAALAKATGA